MDSFALVDTNVISYLFRRDSRGEAYKPLMASFQHLGISFQTLAELELWVIKNNWGRRRRADLTMNLQRFQVILCDETTCDWWARVRSDREKAGRPIRAEDAWIAATALDLGCPLITHDAGDFAGIDGLRILTSNEIRQ